MKIFYKILTLLLTVFLPLMIILTAGRIIWNPFFLDYEYNLPNFPPDEFGFTTADRLQWGKISMHYIIGNVDDNYLSTLKFPDGSRLFNEREVSHMLDVRIVVQAALKVWYALWIFIALLVIMGLLTKQLKQLCRAVSYGGWLTLGLIAIVIAAILVDFNAFFAAFHSLFFKGGTWLFYTNDTLIRLFPEKLWSDGFIYAGILTLVMALVCAFVGGRLAQKD